MTRVLVCVAALALPTIAFAQSRVSTPTFSVEAGEYSTVVMVSVSVSTSGATIHFTQNGSDPTQSDPVIASGSKLAINTSLTLKARAFLHGRPPSEVRTAAYTIVARDADRPLGPGDAAVGGAGFVLAMPDGHVVSWLRDSPPQSVDELSTATRVAVGGGHALVVTHDGQVFGWGANNAGQLGDGTHAGRRQPVRVDGLGEVVRVAAGRAHSLALTADGRVWTWGANNHGQLGVASTEHQGVPTPLPSLLDVVAIDAGDSHSVAVTGSGELYAWGANNHAQLGDGSQQDRRAPVRIELSGVVAVAAGDTHTLALTRDGTVYAWGSGSRGQLGTGSLVGEMRPVTIPNLSAYTVRAGRDFSGAVGRDGALLMWGANESGQLGDGTAIDRAMPVRGPLINAISAFSLGRQHSVAVTASGDVWTWGGNSETVETLSDVADWGPPIAPEIVAPPVIQPASGPYPAPQTITMSSESDDVMIRYTLDGSDPTADSTIYSEPFVVSANTVVIARAFASRPDGEPSETSSASYVIDMSPPTIVVGTSAPIGAGWVTGPLTITFECADDSGAVSCPSPIDVLSDGASQLISGTAIDPAGNRATASVTVSVDRTPPAVLLDDSPDDRTTTDVETLIHGRTFDSTSGLSEMLRCNGEPVPVSHQLFECRVTLRPGVNSVTLQAADLAGHVTAAGIVITRVGDPASIAIAPDSRRLLINETAGVSLRDDYGATVSGAAWSSSDTAVVVMSSDDPPLVTAVAAGIAIISATKNGMSAESTITVDPADVLLPGVTRWTIAPSPGATIALPIFTHRVDPETPDLFLVETPASGEATLRAVTAEGEELWRQQSPGVPLMGDSFGGVVAGILYDGTADFYRAYVRLGKAAGVPPWRYDSAGALMRPAQSSDGTIYAIEYMHAQTTDGEDVWDKHVVVLDGRNGRVLQRGVLPREVVSFTAELDGLVIREQPRLVCTSTLRENEPSTVGPVVGSDGRGYVLMRRLVKHKFDTCLEQHARHRRVIENAVELIILSPDAAPVVQSLFADACDLPAFARATCDVAPELRQVLPDGIGGVLASWDRFDGYLLNGSLTWQRVVTRRAEEGTLLDTPVTNDTWIDTIGQAGIAYVFSSASWRAVDVMSWTPKWTASLGTSAPLAAHPDGGLSVFDLSTQTYRTIDGSGSMQADNEMSLPLRWPMQEFGSWIGLSSLGLTSIAGRLDDATRWISGWGNRHGQSAARRPGIGIFAKGHHITSAIPLWMHASLRITPVDSSYWRQHPRFGQYFRDYVDEHGHTRPAVDVFGNPSATIGGGPYSPNGADTTAFCLVNSILEGRPNRPGDQLIAPLYWQQLTLRGSENPFIEKLFDLDSKYGDFLRYECVPDDADEFNSNSYLSGILSAADISKPWFPQQLPFLFPGWSKPVPARYFGQ